MLALTSLIILIPPITKSVTLSHSTMMKLSWHLKSPGQDDFFAHSALYLTSCTNSSCWSTLPSITMSNALTRQSLELHHLELSSRILTGFEHTQVPPSVRSEAIQIRMTKNSLKLQYLWAPSSCSWPSTSMSSTHTAMLHKFLELC